MWELNVLQKKSKSQISAHTPFVRLHYFDMKHLQLSVRLHCFDMSNSRLTLTCLHTPVVARCVQASSGNVMGGRSRHHPKGTATTQGVTRAETSGPVRFAGQHSARVDRGCMGGVSKPDQARWTRRKSAKRTRAPDRGCMGGASKSDQARGTRGKSAKRTRVPGKIR